MEIVTIVLDLILIIIAMILYFSLPAYLKEKGKNLATKEDVEAITKKIESIKSEFEKERIKLSIYYKKQSDVIDEFYKMMNNCIQELSRFTIHVMPFKEVSHKVRRSWVTEKITEASEYFLNNQLYFDRESNGKIYTLIANLGRINADLDALQFSEDSYEDKFKKWNDLHKEFLLKWVTEFINLSSNLRTIISGESPSEE